MLNWKQFFRKRRKIARKILGILLKNGNCFRFNGVNHKYFRNFEKPQFLNEYFFLKSLSHGSKSNFCLKTLIQLRKHRNDNNNSIDCRLNLSLLKIWIKNKLFSNIYSLISLLIGNYKKSPHLRKNTFPSSLTFLTIK